MIGKPPPADLDAEKATLGSILLDRDAIIPVAPWLMPEFFYADKHTWIYEAQLACYNQRIPPDLVNVTDELRRRERLDSIGGVSYLIELSNSVPTAVHIEYYGRIVERTALMRGLISAGSKIAHLGYDETEDFNATLDQAEAELHKLSQRQVKDGAVPIGELTDTYFDFINRLGSEGGASIGLRTGFTDLDELTGGLQRSDLLILAARPAVGKTSLALNIAQNAATESQARVVIFSLEMSRDQLMQRMLSTHTGIDMQSLRLGDIQDTALQTITEALGELSKLHIWVDDTPDISIMEMRSKCRRMQAEHGIDLVIVDYLQLMAGTVRRDGNRVQEVSEISRGLKHLARELNVPVIALSQLSRAVEGRSSHVPMLSDLRESGSLEQDADIVMFIYREELYDPETDKKGVAELHLAKHRNGPTGVVPMRFFKSTTKFANLDTYRRLEGY